MIVLASDYAWPVKSSIGGLVVSVGLFAVLCRASAFAAAARSALRITLSAVRPFIVRRSRAASVWSSSSIVMVRDMIEIIPYIGRWNHGRLSNAWCNVGGRFRTPMSLGLTDTTSSDRSGFRMRSAVVGCIRRVVVRFRVSDTGLTIRMQMLGSVTIGGRVR